jgi:nitroimidazol reductase NimA-like FMN-containing flavoprotein (pyridoxamine 5'-phosphate oxidase superfamily)
MMEGHELTERLRDLFLSQRLAVLATQEGGQPHLSLVAFATTDDLGSLIFATSRATRKFANITRDSRVAMLVDDRSNKETDFHGATAVTALGRADEIKAPEMEDLARHFLEKHPSLEEFVQSPTSALVKVTVETYYIVSQFQNVTELKLSR